MEISQRVWELLCGHYFHFEFFAKGYNSVKNVGEVMALVLCAPFDDALHLYQHSKVRENISKGF